MVLDISKADWKLFRERLPEWQEAFMEKLNREYIDILSQDRNASDNFWELEKRIRDDKRKTGVLARDVKRSNMDYLLRDLVLEGAIGLDDLDGFSDEVRERIRMLTKISRD